MEEAQAASADARERIEILQPLSVTLPPTGLPAGRDVLRLDQDATAGYLPGRPVIRDLDLAIIGPERVAVSGPNGSGKTTLLSLTTGALQPWSGKVRVMSRFAFLDQGVTLLDPAQSIRDNFRRLNPEADENACRAALARMMFRADAALQVVGTLSGGQMLRAGLACALGGPNPPPLLVLDEPTNHLDIDAIEAVEAGLRAYDGALLVVSHDEAFLAAIGITRRLEFRCWRPVAKGAGGVSRSPSIGRIRGRNRRRKHRVALALVAAETAKEIALRLGLDAFGVDAQAKAAAEPPPLPDDRRRLPVVRQLADDERSILISAIGKRRR